MDTLSPDSSSTDIIEHFMLHKTGPCLSPLAQYFFLKNFLLWIYYEPLLEIDSAPDFHTMIKVAELHGYDTTILHKIVDRCRILYGRKSSHPFYWTYREQIITMFTKLYVESGNREFYESVCRVPFVSRRDKLRIYTARMQYMGKKVPMLKGWPFFWGRHF